MERDISLCRMRTILTNLTSRVSELFEKLAHEYTKEDRTVLKNLIVNLQHLGRLIETKMTTSPEEERERASNLTAALMNGTRALQEAEDLRKTLGDIRTEHRNSVEQVREEINREMKLLEGIKLQETLEITQRRKKKREFRRQLEIQMKSIMDETLMEKRQIEADIELKKIECRSTCAENLKREKELYKTRKEVERRYLEILAKYDREVGELHRTMESLIGESDFLANKIKNLEETLRIQEVEYVQLKNERETAIREAFQESLKNFMRLRAVKKIQRMWRTYWERQQLRKKKKSKKKK